MYLHKGDSYIRSTEGTASQSSIRVVARVSRTLVPKAKRGRGFFIINLRGMEVKYYEI